MVVFGALGLVALLLLLCLGSQVRRERVGGQLLPSGGLIEVDAVSTGSIAHVLVKEGQSVEEDQPLLEISTDVTGATTGAVAEAVNRGLEQQHRRLESDLADQQTARDRATASAREDITVLRAQRDVIDVQIDVRKRQLASTHDLLERVRPLAERGLVGQFELRQQESQMLDADVQLRSAVLQRLQVQRQLDAAQDLLRQQPVRDAGRRHEIESRLADIDQALARNDTQRSVVIRAPRAGEVSGLTVAEGQTVAAGSRLLALIPMSSKLQAELWVPSRAIGFVRVGDQVVLRYDAFPYQTFGPQFGRVCEVMHIGLTAPDASRLLGQPVSAPVYRVLVELEHQTPTFAGTPLLLRPNMTLAADIVLDRRSLIDWLFRPAKFFGPRSANRTALASNRAL